MRILVWGLGYVGTVSAACLARLGHDVVGIETNPSKADAINSGQCAIKEPRLQDLVSQAVKEARLRATTKGADLVSQADVSLICVGTPNGADGSPNLNFVESVVHEIGSQLNKTSTAHTIVLRSTVFPGTCRNLLKPILEKASGQTCAQDFGIVMNPEFLREGSAINDFFTPPYTIIGEMDQQFGKVAANLYYGIEAPIRHITLEEAEMLKVTNNAFHALKVGFGNEIGRLCDALDIDSHKIMDLVCMDKKLNISPAYLRPGFAFGGSCLPKDLRFLSFNARRLGVEIPILDSILPSNRVQVNAVRIKIHQMEAKRVGILGLSFKAQTDDLRESPIITLIRDLWEDGIDVRVHDPDVDPDVMLGSNLDYLERQLPQIRRILVKQPEDMIQKSEVVVMTQNRQEFVDALSLSRRDIPILDLVRFHPEPSTLGFSKYMGVSW